MPTAIRLRPADTNSSCNCGRHQVEGFEETDALRFMEYPLRVLAFAAQVRAKLWVRNGFSVTNQLHNYTMPNCRGYVRSALPSCYLGTHDVAACSCGNLMSPSSPVSAASMPWLAAAAAGCLPVGLDKASQLLSPPPNPNH